MRLLFCAASSSGELPFSSPLLMWKTLFSSRSSYTVPTPAANGCMTVNASNLRSGTFASASLSCLSFPWRTSWQNSANDTTTLRLAPATFSLAGSGPLVVATEGAMALACDNGEGAGPAAIGLGVEKLPAVARDGELGDGDSRASGALPPYNFCMRARSDSRSCSTDVRIFLRCSRCSMPSVFLRSSSFRCSRSAPSTAPSANARLYWPNVSVSSHLPTSATLHPAI